MDLGRITDKELWSEVGRRRRARVRHARGGRPPVYRACPVCRCLFAARQLIRHTPTCRRHQKKRNRSAISS